MKPHHPVTDHAIAPLVQRRVLGVQDDSQLSHAPALAVGSAEEARPSSSPHVNQPTAPPQSKISPFIPISLENG